jgi:hypothetical protein|nr:hypothetical protein [Kofleriaceae bacterium]
MSDSQPVRAPMSTGKRAAWAALWLALAIPAFYQVGLLATAIYGRLTYPFDLEWMEGGMLDHALRIQQGAGIYVPPSIDFIPYLYTPLYPSLLALLGNAVGLSYTLGRAISVLALVGIAAVAVASISGARFEHARRAPALAGAALAMGLFAAIYPFVEGWMDLVRADTLFLFIATAGVAACARWAAIGDGRQAHVRVGVAAAILVLAFFTKQTGIFYVALGGGVVLVTAWRRTFVFVGVAGVLGLGLTGLLNWISDGWFWIYVSKIHRAHDFSWDRFEQSFGKILWHFPAMTIVVAVTLVVVVAAWARAKRLPPQARPFVLWTAAYAVSTVVGAVGWGTEWAFWNAYMPAFLHGALAAGAALPALAASARVLVPEGADGRDAWRERAAVIAPVLAALALGVTLLRAGWDPAKFVPNDGDVEAGNKLIADIRAIDGEVWVPSHPWYAVLAGKAPHVHRMGIKDVTDREPKPVRGLESALRDHAFAAIVFDAPDLTVEQQPELVGVRELIKQTYRVEVKLETDEQPRSFTGARVRPDAIWVPAVPATPPPGARALFDFEQPTWEGWTRSGGAWGRGPVNEVVGAVIAGATGKRFASSAAGDAASAPDAPGATGRVSSPPFVVHGARITMKLGGAVDPKLRVELHAVATDGEAPAPPAPLRTASVPLPGGPLLHSVAWDVHDLDGQTVQLVLVDDSESKGGYLVVDDVWMWDR